MNEDKEILLNIIKNAGACSISHCALRKCPVRTICPTRTLTFKKEGESWRRYVVDRCIGIYAKEYGIDNLKDDLVEYSI